MFLFLFFVISFLHGFAVGKDCKINQDKDWFDPENVYQCPNDKMCCIESDKPSCCADKAVNDEVIDQVKLWGCVVGAAILLAIGLFICCCRRDNSCCNEEATCKYYMTCGCCCGSRKSRNEVPYEKVPSLSSSTDLCNKDSVLSVNQIDNLKIASSANMKNEAHLQSEKLAVPLA